MSAEVSNFETMTEETKEEWTANLDFDAAPITAHPDDLQKNDNADHSDMLLARIKQNAMLHPNKRAMAFLVPSSTGAGSKTTISQECTYVQVESESTALAISLLEKHKLKKGDRCVKILNPNFCGIWEFGAILTCDRFLFPR
jgi:hypothetical protein